MLDGTNEQRLTEKFKDRVRTATKEAEAKDKAQKTQVLTASSQSILEGGKRKGKSLSRTSKRTKVGDPAGAALVSLTASNAQGVDSFFAART